MAYSRNFNITKIIVLLLALACLAAFPAYSASLGSELITNTGFESGSTGWSLGANTSRDTSTGHSGSASIKLSAATTPTSVYFSGLSCFAGRKVNISAWAKTVGTDDSQGGSVIEIKCLNSANRVIGSQRTYPTATGGAWKQVQLAAMVPLNAASMRLTLINTSNSGNAWFDDISCLFANAVSFRTMIRQPEYRQTIFAGDPRRVVIGAEVYDSTINPAASLAIRSDLIKPDGTVISSSLLKTVVNKSWQNLGISIPPGIAGELTVRSRLLARASGAVLRETTDKVLVDSNNKPLVHFDDQNRCIVNSSPFFPICIIGDQVATADLDRLQAAGVNSILDYGMLSRTLADQKSFLDALQSRNMKAVYPLHNLFQPLHGEDSLTAWGNWTGVSNAISGLVNANKNHPALLAWQINDLRSGDYINQLKTAYDQVISLDPQHPCFQSLEGMQDYGNHTGTSDVSGLASFPVWQRYADSASSAYMPMFGSQTRVAFKSGMYSRPVWMLAETAKFVQPTNSVAPTAQQILCEAYQAIINGARGVVLSNLTNVKTGGDTQYQALETVAQNLKAIAPIALGEEVSLEERVTSSNPNIECTTRRVGEDVYVLAVNTSSSTIPASFTVPEKLASKNGHAVDSGVPGSEIKLVVFSGNNLSDSIVSNGTKVYKLRKYSLDILRDSPKPNFKKGHTLPRLSYWVGNGVPFNTTKQLVEDWGYAFQLSLNDPKFLTNHAYGYEKIQFDIMELAKSDPDRYPLFIIPRHYWGSSSTYLLPESMWCHLDGNNGTEATRILSNRGGYTLHTAIGKDDMVVDTQKVITATQTYHDPYIGGIKTITRPLAGWIVIDSETMAYSSFSSTEWVISERGAFGTTVANHALGQPIFETPQCVYSPEAPTSIFEATGENWASIIKDVRSVYPTVKVSVALNGAEYGLAPAGIDYLNWWKDPDVKAARLAYNTAYENTSFWFNYISHNKARQELPIATALKTSLPHDTLYVNYGIGGGCRVKSNPAWVEWGFDFTKLKVATDVPSHESYFGPWPYHQSWTETGYENILDKAFNATTQQIDVGSPLQYGFVSAGWGSVVAEKPIYTGFLKMLYAMGNIGAAQFYGILSESDPNWLWQFEQMGHVHALYSHLEDYLRNGDLLPGPHKHKWSKDLPAYEFPTGHAWARVVVRKKKTSNDWLIAAWAQDGVERTVTISVPTLGDVTVTARAAGSVYTAELDGSTPVLTLIDTDAMNPTLGFDTK